MVPDEERLGSGPAELVVEILPAFYLKLGNQTNLDEAIHDNNIHVHVVQISCDTLGEYAEP